MVTNQYAGFKWLCITATLAASGCLAVGEVGDSEIGEGVTEVDVSVQDLQVQLFADEFEVDLSQWVVSGACSRNSAAMHANAYGARCDDVTSLTRTINTTGYSGITLSYWRRTNSYDSGENFYAEWSADGNTWSNIETTANNSTWTQKTFTLPASANNIPALRVRLRSNASGFYERFDLDQVAVTGDNGCVPSCNGATCGNDGCGGSCGYCTGAGEVCTNGACEYGPAPPAIYSTTFDTGTSGWTLYSLDCSNDSASAANGARGVRCGDGGIGGYVYWEGSTSGYNDIMVEYRRRTSTNYGLGEYFVAQWSTDYPNYNVWNTLEQIANDGTYRYVAFKLPAAAANQAHFRLQFDNNTSLMNENYDIDDVAVRGLSVSGCTPDCAGKSCGSDGCGGSCGSCGSGTTCSNGACVCVPDCAGSNCGDNGCGGSCGTCSGGQVCNAGQCQNPSCTPNCSGKECGADGCGGSCGTCNASETCSSGQCVCAPNCAGKTCGPDGCGGSCGTCTSGQSCNGSGTCQAAVDAPASLGPKTQCSYTSGLTDPGYESAIVWYPCTMTGLLGATTLTGGYTNTKEQMEWLSKHVASHNYIVIAMTPVNKNGDTTQWYNAQIAGKAKLLSETNRSASPIFNRVDPARLQIMGFSKGGGGVIRAAAYMGSSIKTAQALAPYLESTYTNSNWNMGAPIIMHTGESDTFYAPHDRVRTFFDHVSTNVDRLFVRTSAASHTQWYGANSSSNATDRTRFTTHVISWMKVYLDGNTAYMTYINGAQFTAQSSAGWYQAPNGSGTSDDYSFIDVP